MEITTETGYRMIDRALDNNIMVFDNNNSGIVTKKLVFHMKHHCKTITTILVPSDAYVENLPDDWSFGHTITIFNVGIYWDDRLQENMDPEKCGKWLQYFNMRGGSIHCGNTNLVIGFDNESDDVILGSF
jgi:hypothetical protein